MKKLLLLATVIGAAAIVPRAQAGFSFSIGFGHHYSPPPVYVAPPVCPPPVYVAPPICVPRPVYVAPAPVYYVPGPVYHAPPRLVVYGGHHGYKKHYRHHRRYCD